MGEPRQAITVSSPCRKARALPPARPQPQPHSSPPVSGLEGVDPAHLKLLMDPALGASWGPGSAGGALAWSLSAGGSPPLEEPSPNPAEEAGLVRWAEGGGAEEWARSRQGLRGPTLSALPVTPATVPGHQPVRVRGAAGPGAGAEADRRAGRGGGDAAEEPHGIRWAGIGHPLPNTCPGSAHPAALPHPGRGWGEARRRGSCSPFTAGHPEALSGRHTLGLLGCQKGGPPLCPRPPAPGSGSGW